jgi:hypothetical protein
MHTTTITAALALRTNFTLALSSSPSLLPCEPNTIANIKPATFLSEVIGQAYSLTGTIEQVWRNSKSTIPPSLSPTSR